MLLQFRHELKEPGHGLCGSKEHLNNKKLLVHASFQYLSRVLNKPLHVCYSLSFPGRP
jgi:hypothetical protein